MANNVAWKPLVITGSLCLAVGSTLGYTISDVTKPSAMIAQSVPTPSPTATPPKPPAPITRNELERRYIACLGRNLNLTRLTDADLNNDLYECESQRKISK